jgi:hypothetical protein
LARHFLLKKSLGKYDHVDKYIAEYIILLIMPASRRLGVELLKNEPGGVGLSQKHMHLESAMKIIDHRDAKPVISYFAIYSSL